MQPPLSTAIGHALKLKCPKCGQGKIYARYLKQVDACAACETKWGEVRADDGPAWFTILIVGHIMASIAVWAAMATDWPTLYIIGILTIGTIALTLAFLPFAKAVFLAVLWKTGAKANSIRED